MSLLYCSFILHYVYFFKQCDFNLQQIQTYENSFKINYDFFLFSIIIEGVKYTIKMSAIKNTHTCLFTMSQQISFKRKR